MPIFIGKDTIFQSLRNPNGYSGTYGRRRLWLFPDCLSFRFFLFQIPANIRILCTTRLEGTLQETSPLQLVPISYILKFFESEDQDAL